MKTKVTKAGRITAAEVFSYFYTLGEDGCNGISPGPISVTGASGTVALSMYAGSGAYYIAAGMCKEGVNKVAYGLTSGEAAAILEAWIGTGERVIDGTHPRATCKIK